MENVDLSKLVFKFNPNTKTTLLTMQCSLACVYQAKLFYGKDVSVDKKVWLIIRMNEQTYFNKKDCTIAEMGWGVCFKPFMTRFIYRLTGSSEFVVLYAFDRESAEGYLKYLCDKLYEDTDDGVQSVAELYELPEQN